MPCRRCGMLHRRLPPSKSSAICDKCGMVHSRQDVGHDCGRCAKRSANMCMFCSSEKDLTPILVFETMGQ
jgi:hypothetical protein